MIPVDTPSVTAEVTRALQAVLGDFGADAPITPESTFRDDLGMESIDVVALAGRLQARYGAGVNLAQFVASLDVDSVRELRVGQLVDHIVLSMSAAGDRL
ncbi:acyl carrier protein [Actinoplanes sp. NPDC026619]|uniref:acyl carrier protein n=1 Tax=Actinoplanes sp. NPDC026619 TaxID=3155798 RepID=UPI0033CB60E5